MVLPYNLENLRDRPSMCVPTPDYDCVCSYLLGMDCALNGGLLQGFHEWTTTKLGYANNLLWSEKVLFFAFEGESPRNKLKTNEDHQTAIKILFDLLEKYFKLRQEFDGMRTIYLGFENWIRKQSWYNESSPSWIKE